MGQGMRNSLSEGPLWLSKRQESQCSVKGFECQAQDFNCHSQSLNGAGVDSGPLLGGPVHYTFLQCTKRTEKSGCEPQYPFLGLAKRVSPPFGSPWTPLPSHPSVTPSQGGLPPTWTASSHHGLTSLARPSSSIPVYARSPSPQSLAGPQ